ncbi:MAG: prepilin peptidase [Chloroflexota bacterium]
MENFFVLLMVACLGWLLGVLVNYLADVLPWTRRITPPMCVTCQAEMRWKNYFLWPRSCTACGRRRGVRVWLVEATYVLLALGMWLYPHKYLGFWLSLILLVFFGVVAVIDIEYRLILHQVSLAGAFLAVLLGVIWRAQHFFNQPGLVFSSFAPWWYGIWTSLLGGAIGFGFMGLLYIFGGVFLRLAARRRGQEVDDVALGFGDVNLAGILGLLLGWPLVTAGLFFGVLIGGLVSLAYLLMMMALRRYHLFMALPYGPFLIAGAVFVIYFRETLLQLLQVGF